jgi:hypothetical protein
MEAKNVVLNFDRRREMKAANITVNLPDGERSYDAVAGETPPQLIGRAVALHPDWTSMILVLVRSAEG